MEHQKAKALEEKLESARNIEQLDLVLFNAQYSNWGKVWDQEDEWEKDTFELRLVLGDDVVTDEIMEILHTFPEPLELWHNGHYYFTSSSAASSH